MKQLYLYIDPKQPGLSNAFTAKVAELGLTATTLRLDRDTRIHSVEYPGVQAVIDIDNGRKIIEVRNPANLGTAWAAAPDTVPLPPPPPHRTDMSEGRFREIVFVNDFRLVAEATALVLYSPDKVELQRWIK